MTDRRKSIDKHGAAIPADVLEAIARSDFDRGRSLELISRMKPAEQKAFAEHVRNGRIVLARQMISHPRLTVVVQMPGNCTREVRNQLVRLDNAWKAASDEARTRFIRRLEKRGEKVPWQKEG